MLPGRLGATWAAWRCRRRTALAAAWLALACTASQSFRPAEHVTGRSPEGALAAEYDLRPPGGTKAGDVRLWSEGAWSDGAADATVWHVGFELESEGNEPVTLDPSALRLTNVRYLESEAAGLRPTRIEGETATAPGGRSTFAVYFRLPGVDPEDIDGFRIAWTVTSGPHQWSEQTPFVAAASRWRGNDYPPYWGPYPPYYGPYPWRRPIYRYVPTPTSRPPPRHHPPPARR